MDNDELIDTLNHLIEICRDGDNGFTTCAQHVENPSLRAYFIICSTRCREASRALTDHVLRYGGMPEEHGSLLGSAHRAWVNMRTILADPDDQAMLDECERGEDAALHAYQAALQKPLPADVRQTVQQQLDGTQDNHDRVRQLRDDLRLSDTLPPPPHHSTESIPTSRSLP